MNKSSYSTGIGIVGMWDEKMTFKPQDMRHASLRRSGPLDLETRAARILNFLLQQNKWLSAKEINNKFDFVHSTLWKALRLLQDEDLVVSCRSLADTRVTMYRASPNITEKADTNLIRTIKLQNEAMAP
ncbi:MAG: MarR family transcriptional regulator [Candidatus Ranarchaeia archaeon]